MEEQSQQINTYIRQHFGQGFSETDIRSHLLANGWSQDAINRAFEQYRHESSLQSPMAIPPQLSPHHQPPHLDSKKHRHSLLKWLVVIVIAIVLIVVAALAYVSRHPATVSKLERPALERYADNTSRENDVSKIASALATYISGHQSNFPQSTTADATPGTLAICGPDCTPTNKVTVQLQYYANTPSAVSFRSYTAGLTVPDGQTVYLIPNANCSADKSGLGTSTIGQKYLSIVVLYAIQSGNGIKQQCLSPY
jgi:hypothetical protein